MQEIVFQRLEKRFFEDFNKQVADARAALNVPADPHERVEVLGRLGMLLLADAKTKRQGLRLLTEAYDWSLKLGLSMRTPAVIESVGVAFHASCA